MSDDDLPVEDEALEVDPEEIKDLDAAEEGDDVKGGFRSAGCYF
ncbi:MAG TPA: hypothetical protein VM938_01330 [Acidimicrobiales bacterium]|nr:hypothetical protein [Acidimicrobiales bacterium]